VILDSGNVCRANSPGGFPQTPSRGRSPSPTPPPQGLVDEYPRSLRIAGVAREFLLSTPLLPVPYSLLDGRLMLQLARRNLAGFLVQTVAARQLPVELNLLCQ
jgi:hypothetical protein